MIVGGQFWLHFRMSTYFKVRNMVLEFDVVVLVQLNVLEHGFQALNVLDAVLILHPSGEARRDHSVLVKSVSCVPFRP